MKIVLLVLLIGTLLAAIRATRVSGEPAATLANATPEIAPPKVLRRGRWRLSIRQH